VEFWSYLGLFGIAFAAATLLPAQSELVLAGLIASGDYNPWLLIAAATAGNVLGSCLNWTIGRFLNGYRGSRWFPVSARSLERAERSYRRFGVWTLLLSWVPVIGDPMTLVAGLLGTPFKLFLALVFVAKLGRYLAVVGGVQLWL
jgi:membrane protein YqaA with SNARE-associated domain